MKETGHCILACLVFVVIFLGYAFVQLWANDCAWNNGHCEKCGGQWVFVNGSNWKHYDSLWYRCQDCGNVIEIVD